MIKEDVDEGRLDRIEGILRQKRSEALKRKYVEYERQLASMVDAPSPSLRALRLHAELAVLRRHWKQAAVRWKRFLDAGGTLDSKSALLAVRSLREGATPREAYALLRRVNSELGIEPARFKRERRAIRRARVALQARESTQQLMEAVGKGDSAAALEHAEAVLRSRRFSAEVARSLAPLAERVVQFPQASSRSFLQRHVLDRVARLLWTRQCMNWRDEGTRPQVRAIFSAGFGYSGSGAITDFLRGHDKVRLAFGRPEVPWWTGQQRRALPGAASLLQASWNSRAVYENAIRDFFLATVLGIASAGEKSLDPAMLARISLVQQVSGKMDAIELAAQLEELLAALLRARRGGRTLAVLQGFFSRVVNAPLAEGQWCLFDNAIKAYQLSALCFAPGSRAIVTRRDPRDQYVARMLEGRNKFRNVDSFIRIFERREQRVQDVLTNASLRAMVMEVNFERFVLEPAVRSDVLAWLGLDQEAVNDGFFEPELSAANIGIHKHWHRQEDIAAITRELRPYLREEADR